MHYAPVTSLFTLLATSHDGFVCCCFCCSNIMVVDGCSTIPILWPYITRARLFPRCTHTHLYRCSVVLSFPDTYNCWSRPVFLFFFFAGLARLWRHHDPDSHFALVCVWRARARIRLRTAETCADVQWRLDDYAAAVDEHSRLVMASVFF